MKRFTSHCQDSVPHPVFPEAALHQRKMTTGSPKPTQAFWLALPKKSKASSLMASAKAILSFGLGYVPNPSPITGTKEWAGLKLIKMYCDCSGLWSSVHFWGWKKAYQPHLSHVGWEDMRMGKSWYFDDHDVGQRACVYFSLLISLLLLWPLPTPPVHCFSE